jgi:hypothetical protein
MRHGPAVANHLASLAQLGSGRKLKDQRSNRLLVVDDRQRHKPGVRVIPLAFSGAWEQLPAAQWARARSYSEVQPHR